MPLPESWELEVPALIRMLGVKLAPPVVLNAPQNWASSFGIPSVSPGPPVPASLRASYQTAATLPVVGSSEIFGRNWLLAVWSSFSRTAALQLAPPSSECRERMSVLSLSFGDSRVYTM